ncbi:MAG: pitrilysin family protein [Bacteroidia bacterium]
MSETHKSPETFVFPNGIRLIHLEVSNEVAHLGVYINAGSRDELNHEFGLAHFIEHAIFKGTQKRKAYHILSRMEDVGGELNAYTSKEETCIYSSFLHSHYKRAAELLADITFHSVFPEKELAKEKTVIIDEINSYKDSPSEEIFDRFEDQIFKDHSLGHDILGTPKHLKSFDQKKVADFIKRTWNTDQMVISSVGKISLKKLIQILQATFGDIPPNLRQFRRPEPADRPASHFEHKKKVHQSHLIIGSKAYSMHNKKRTPLILLNNLLGGPGMSSRLNLNIRERYGWTYHIESSFSMFSDSGIWNVYLGTETSYIEKCNDLVHKELKKLRESSLGILQLQRAKNQLIGQLAISQENNISLMLGYAKTFAIFNKIDSFKDICKKIENVKPASLQDVANELFNSENLSSLLYSGK